MELPDLSRELSAPVLAARLAAAIAPIAMLFVRCRGGLSHHPDAFASAADIEVGARVLLATLRGRAIDGIGVLGGSA